MSGIGHNSVHSDQLRLFLERVERLEEDKKAVADDIKDVFAEIKGQGYDLKTVREMLKLRKMEKSALQEKEALRDTYMHALGLTDLLG